MIRPWTNGMFGRGGTGAAGHGERGSAGIPLALRGIGQGGSTARVSMRDRHRLDARFAPPINQPVATGRLTPASAAVSAA